MKVPVIYKFHPKSGHRFTPELRCTKEVSGGSSETGAVQPRTPSLPAGHQDTGSRNPGIPVLAWATTEGCQLLLMR